MQNKEEIEALKKISNSIESLLYSKCFYKQKGLSIAKEMFAIDNLKEQFNLKLKELLTQAYQQGYKDCDNDYKKVIKK